MNNLLHDAIKSRKFWICAAAIVLLIAAGIAADQYRERVAAENRKALVQSRLKMLADREAARPPEERAAEAKARADKIAADAKAQGDQARAEQLKEVRFQKTVAFLKTVYRQLREPESVAWETILANDDASVICVRYRAKNGFGGYGRDIAVFADGSAGSSSEEWNDNCAHRTFNNMISARHAVNW